MNKKLIYKSNPKKTAKSSLYFISILADILGVSCNFALNSINKKLDIKTSQKYVDDFANLHFDNTGTNLYATGLENFDHNKTYLFMSNHSSWMDIPSIIRAVPQHLRMVAKDSLLKIPIFGKAMAGSGFIGIDRTNRAKAIKQLESAKEKLKEGVCICIFPEGTRSKDGKIKEFKRGGFYLALDLKLKIVPVFIEGASDVMPCNSMSIFTNKDVTIHFLKPIATDNYSKSNLLELINLVRNQIIEKQESLRRNDDSLQ